MSNATNGSNVREPAASVSVVIPYYNGSRYIAEALASVRAQTAPPLETVIVDDGSRPEEAEALDRAVAAAGFPCRVVHLPRNRGVSVARNVGIARAAGTHVAFLDCDDLWRPDKLEKQMRFLAEHPEYGGVHAGMKAVYFSGLERVDHKSEVRFDDLVRFPCPIFPSALILRRDAMFECGLFDPTKRVCEDLDLFLRFTSQYPIGCVDEPLVIRRVMEEAASRNFGAFYHDADRVYRDYRYVFKDDRAAAAALLDVHADFLLRAVYTRDAKLAWRILRRGARAEVPAHRLFLRAVRDLVKARGERRERAAKGERQQ